MSDFLLWQYLAVGVIFIWTGFVRAGLGFGGAALGLPFLLLVENDPLLFLPLIGLHLLFFSSLTIGPRLKNVDWRFMLKSLAIIIIPKFIGILGLLSLPAKLMTAIVFTITFIYGITYVFDYNFKSNNKWGDRALLALGGYISGTSLVGAPLIVAVYTRYVRKEQLRDTLLSLWFILVCLKMSAFIASGIDLQLKQNLWLIPMATIGHVLGLRWHDHLQSGNAGHFKRIMGLVLIVVTTIGLMQVLLTA